MFTIKNHEPVFFKIRKPVKYLAGVKGPKGCNFLRKSKKKNLELRKQFKLNNKDCNKIKLYNPVKEHVMDLIENLPLQIIIFNEEAHSYLMDIYNNSNRYETDLLIKFEYYKRDKLINININECEKYLNHIIELRKQLEQELDELSENGNFSLPMLVFQYKNHLDTISEEHIEEIKNHLLYLKLEKNTPNKAINNKKKKI